MQLDTDYLKLTKAKFAVDDSGRIHVDGDIMAYEHRLLLPTGTPVYSANEIVLTRGIKQDVVHVPVITSVGNVASVSGKIYLSGLKHVTFAEFRELVSEEEKRCMLDPHRAVFALKTTSFGWRRDFLRAFVKGLEEVGYTNRFN